MHNPPQRAKSRRKIEIQSRGTGRSRGGNSETMYVCVCVCVPRNIKVPTHPPRQDTAVAVCTRVPKLGPRVNAAISG
jgi:hypothetical protein